MNYRDFGNTGVKVSLLGFGSMRLPEEKVSGGYHVKEEESIKMIHGALERGVNYIDTAYGYCHSQSEVVVGKALKGWRDKVYLSTKMPTWLVERTGDYRRFLEEQLKKLDVEYIDFYHFHSLNEDSFKKVVLQYDLLKQARKAKEDGLIKHISFSFHDKPEVMKRLIDVGIFESVLCQYNLLDRTNEEAMAYAREKGLGVAVMGPVGGGRLATSDALKEALGGKVRSTPELALRFVFTNRNVCVALSGMENMRMMEENVSVASSFKSLIPEELQAIQNFIEERRKKQEIPCTGCEYCMPCPNNVAIPEIFRLMNYYTVYGLKEYARGQYQNLGLSEENKDKRRADACVECGRCEELCPQKIKIMERLKEAHEVLG